MISSLFAILLLRTNKIVIMKRKIYDGNANVTQKRTKGTLYAWWFCQWRGGTPNAIPSKERIRTKRGYNAVTFRSCRYAASTALPWYAASASKDNTMNKRLLSNVNDNEQGMSHLCYFLFVPPATAAEWSLLWMYCKELFIGSIHRKLSPPLLF